jgi:Bacterial mobilisation protein (MobC).
MKKQKKNKTATIPKIRITAAEKARIMEEFGNTYHSSLSAYVREKVLAKEITNYHKKKIDTLRELAQFRNELIRTGNNINQIARMVNTYKDGNLTAEQHKVLRQLLGPYAQIMLTLDKIKI